MRTAAREPLDWTLALALALTCTASPRIALGDSGNQPAPTAVPPGPVGVAPAAPTPRAHGSPAQNRSAQGEKAGENRKATPETGHPAKARSKQRHARTRARGAASAASAPRTEASAAARTAFATFTGFTMLPGGGSRVYVQLSSNVGIDERKSSPRELVYWLSGAAVPVRNNRNPLLTAHFNTPVQKARLVPGQGGVGLVIDLRVPVEPVHRLSTSPNGGVTLEVDFPPGDYLHGEPETPPTHD